MDPRHGQRPVGVIELFRVFFVIGLTAFGPAVLRSLRSEPVKRGWLRLEDIDEGLGLVQLYPGAMMVDLSAYIGYRVAGIRGAFAATAGFAIPSLVMVLGLSWTYVEYGAASGVADLVTGLNAIVVGVVSSVAVDFARQHARGVVPAMMAVAAFVVGAAGVNLLWVVLAALVLGALTLRPAPDGTAPVAAGFVSVRRLALSLVPAMVVAVGAITAALVPGTLAALTADMAKIGTIAFGNGYTILPVLQQDVVSARHWLSTESFGVGVALGQATPGPVLITAAFIGFVVAGWWGGTLAAVAIFAPSVAMTIVAAEIYPYLRRLPAIRGAIRGVMGAFAGLLAFISFDLGRHIIHLPAALVLAAAAFIAVHRYKWNLPAVFGAGLTAWAVYVAAGGPT